MDSAELNWAECPAVESVPEKLNGVWVLRGTRMPVSAILENLQEGATIDDILSWFDGLDRNQVITVVKFATHSSNSIPILSR